MVSPLVCGAHQWQRFIPAGLIQLLVAPFEMTNFRTFLLTVLSLVSAGSALGSTWKLSDVKVTTLCGVSAISSQEVFAAMADNSLGPGMIHSDDACKTSEFIGPAGGMNMDIAFTPVGNVGCMASLGGLLLTQDGGKTFSKAGNLEAVSQNVEAFGSASLGATGGFTDRSTKKHVNGVAVSTNYGTSWDLFDIGLNSSYIARYGAFPSADTWYVSSGSWPGVDSKVEGAHKLSSRVHLFQASQGKVADFLTAAAGGGYPGAISKTTDSGKTWTKVFDSDNSMYFNEINCYDTEHCMAVAENDRTSLQYLLSPIPT
jgi:hypothetical protein